jgi:hypothetical protein
MGTAMTCTNDNPIPVCHIHGTLDSTVLYTNNTYGNDAEEVVNFWVDKNGCDTEADTVFMPDNAVDNKTVQKITYPNGDFGTEVVFYKIVGGEHEWLYQPANDIMYIFEIWKFFSKYTNQTPNNISITKNQISIEIYPNPTNNKFINIITDNLDVEKISIIDINGKTIKQFREVSNLNILDISNIGKGFYFIQLQTKNGNYSKKITIN